MSSRIASKTTRNCTSYFFSSSASFRASSTWVARSRRSFTNVRMISILTSTARLLRRTLESMATPCSVKTYGRLLAPLLSPELDITLCDFQPANSSALS